MVEKIGHVKNPLTVISIFAGIAEISGTIVLPFIEPDNQRIYIWFLMIFPIFLVAAFFLTLNFNHKKLYAPSDFRDENNFLDALSNVASFKEKQEKLEEEVKEASDVSNSSTNVLTNEASSVVAVPNVEMATQDEQPSSPSTMNQGINRDKSPSWSALEGLAIAERIAVSLMKRQLGVELKLDAKVAISPSRSIIYDAFGVTEGQAHAVEVKYFLNSNFPPSRLDKLLLESENLSQSLKAVLNTQDESKPKFVLHLFIVLADQYADKNAVTDKMLSHLAKFKIAVDLKVTTLEELKMEWQYS